MTTKEKLDLLWKYLLLVVLVFGFYQLGNSRKSSCYGHGMGMKYHKGFSWTSDHRGAMDGMENVEVRIEKMDNGDSTMVVTINGEEVDPATFDMSTMDGMDGHVFIKKIDKGGKSGVKKIRIEKTMEKDE